MIKAKALEIKHLFWRWFRYNLTQIANFYRIVLILHHQASLLLVKFEMKLNSLNSFVLWGNLSPEWERGGSSIHDIYQLEIIKCN